MLNIGTGVYDLVYTVPKTFTTPAFEIINVAGLNPKDTKNYAVVLKDSKSYLCRFDAIGIEVLGQVAGETVAASFDTDGNFYYSIFQNAAHPGDMYMIEGVLVQMHVIARGNGD